MYMSLRVMFTTEQSELTPMKVVLTLAAWAIEPARLAAATVRAARALRKEGVMAVPDERGSEALVRHPPSGGSAGVGRNMSHQWNLPNGRKVRELVQRAIQALQ